MFIVATHDGPIFHADEVIAFAVMQYVLRKHGAVDFIRTRKPEDLANADYVIDVGGVYDGQTRFDHHQPDSPLRPNGRLYATAGLVWLAFGDRFIEIHTKGTLTPNQRYTIWQEIDTRIMQHVDAQDNGQDLNDGIKFDLNANVSIESAYSISNMISDHNLQWCDDQSPDNVSIKFDEAVSFATGAIMRAVYRAIATVQARWIIDDAIESADQVIEFPQYVPWASSPEIYESNAKIAIWPTDQKGWYAQVIPTAPGAKTSRIQFPAFWSDGSAGSFASASGVLGATFAHKGRFLIVATDRESIMQLVDQALHVDGMSNF